MSTYHGPQPGHKTDRGGKKNGPKGVARNNRQLKREEAEERAAAKKDPGVEGGEMGAELIEEIEGEKHAKDKAGR